MVPKRSHPAQVDARHRVAAVKRHNSGESRVRRLP